jgi:hypothetical protein
MVIIGASAQLCRDSWATIALQQLRVASTVAHTIPFPSVLLLATII